MSRDAPRKTGSSSTRSSKPGRSRRTSGGSGSERRSGERRSGNTRGRDDRGQSGRGAGPGRGRGEPKPVMRAERSGWGSVAQHGAIGATVGQRIDEQEAQERFSPAETAKFEQRQARRAKQQERVDGLREEARAAIERSGDKGLQSAAPKERSNRGAVVERTPLPSRAAAIRDVPKELIRRHGKSKGPKLWQQFKRAGREFESERFTEARRSLKPLMATDSDIAEVRELYGLCFYRLGKWDEAIEELEAFRRISLSSEQHPVLMDAHRAIGNWADVDYLWKELGDCSPEASLMTEGRIVLAGSLADRSDLGAAVRTLEKGWKPPRAPQEHHLRRAYALADLYERSGAVPRARKLFDWVDKQAPGYGDASLRSDALI